MKMSIHMGCKVFVVYVMENQYKYNQLKIEDISILKYFKDILLEEVPELPMERDIEFKTDLVLGKVPT